MATLGKDPRYRALATSAASMLGTSSSSIIAAILGQWQCEQPGGPPWPPVHNNPGFVTIGALRSNGINLGSYATRSPGVHFLATFSSPSEGATAYAQLLSRGARYAKVRAAVSRGDGEGFLRAVTAAGYGTRAGCALNAYRSLGGKVTAGGSLASAETFDCAAFQGHLRRLGISTAMTYRFTPTDAAKIAAELYHVSGDVAATIAARYQGKTVADVCGGKIDTGDPLHDVPEAVGQTFDALAAAVGEASFTLVVGGAIAGLFLLGVWRATK